MILWIDFSDATAATAFHSHGSLFSFMMVKTQAAFYCFILSIKKGMRMIQSDTSMVGAETLVAETKCVFFKVMVSILVSISN